MLLLVSSCLKPNAYLSFPHLSCLYYKGIVYLYSACYSSGIFIVIMLSCANVFCIIFCYSLDCIFHIIQDHWKNNSIKICSRFFCFARLRVKFLVRMDSSGRANFEFHISCFIFQWSFFSLLFISHYCSLLFKWTFWVQPRKIIGPVDMADNFLKIILIFKKFKLLFTYYIIAIQ